ncbi:MAG: SH3 domain-containing protein [Spirochaetaceae bacterium]|nr:SH3 domain-containing protein [Spirochaetaceae bacterium]MDT8296707.1 SH3 domain-containing protein [Spirochaetaceae bacterium]
MRESVPRPVTWFLFAVVFLASCGPKDVAVSLDPPPTPILTSESAWGVANKPYQKILESPEPVAGVTGTLRSGDIVEVISKVGSSDGRSYWLEIRTEEGSGWIPDISLDVYDSLPQAQTAGGEREDAP